MKKVLVTSLSLFFLFAAACSSKKNSSMASAEGGTDTTTATDTTLQDPYTQSAATYANLSGSLFDTAQVSTASSTTATSNPITAQQQACLSSSQILTTQGCVESSSLFNSEDDILDFMAGSFGEMNYCYQAVLERGKQVFTQQTLAAQDNAVIFDQAASALVRCYSRIMENQQLSAAWGNEQQKAYDAQQQNMQLFLYLIQSMNGN